MVSEDKLWAQAFASQNGAIWGMLDFVGNWSDAMPLVHTSRADILRVDSSSIPFTHRSLSEIQKPLDSFLKRRIPKKHNGEGTASEISQ